MLDQNHGMTVAVADSATQQSHRDQVKAEPYNWPCTTEFSPANTALVIIDMQNDFCLPGGYLDTQGLSIEPARSVIPAISRLLVAFRAAHFPIYHTREGHRPDLSTLSSREAFRSRLNPAGLGIGDRGPLGRFLVRGEKGHDLVDELTPLPNEAVIDKPGRSTFAHTDFKLLLDVRGVRNLVICGVTTDVCVSSTMREGNDRGLDCLLIKDATAAGVEELHEAAVRSVMEEGGIFGAVADVESVLAALAAVSVEAV